MNTKVCPCCHFEKSIKSFGANTRYLDGLQSYCNPCKNSSKYKNKENEKRLNKNWTDKNKPRRYALNKRWRTHNPEVYLNSRLKSVYKITLEEYNKMKEKQNNICAICFKAQTNKRLAIDHCHSTGKVRGLLCSSCNTALGLLKDNIDSMNNAIIYLQRSK